MGDWSLPRFLLVRVNCYISMSAPWEQTAPAEVVPAQAGAAAAPAEVERLTFGLAAMLLAIGLLLPAAAAVAAAVTIPMEGRVEV